MPQNAWELLFKFKKISLKRYIIFKQSFYLLAHWIATWGYMIKEEKHCELRRYATFAKVLVYKFFWIHRSPFSVRSSRSGNLNLFVTVRPIKKLSRELNHLSGSNEAVLFYRNILAIPYLTHSQVHKALNTLSCWKNHWILMLKPWKVCCSPWQ